MRAMARAMAALCAWIGRVFAARPATPDPSTPAEAGGAATPREAAGGHPQAVRPMPSSTARNASGSGAAVSTAATSRSKSEPAAMQARGTFLAGRLSG